MAGHLQSMAFISMPGGPEWVVILIIGLLVFGRRLPEVARNLGKASTSSRRACDFPGALTRSSDVNGIKTEVTNGVAAESDATGQ
jgi:sec-independent protein translocase protein TatA